MNKVKIVCIGDSLTEGYGVHESKRWTNLLRDKLDIEIINSGISGDTSAGMLARFNEMVIQHKPSHVIIMGGTNDIFLNISDNHILSNILAMTRYARHHEIISIIGIPTPFYNLSAFPDDEQFIESKDLFKRINIFYQSLKQFILDDEQRVIDFTLNMKAELFFNDGVHPNEKGHECMSEIAGQSLKNILFNS